MDEPAPSSAQVAQSSSSSSLPIIMPELITRNATLPDTTTSSVVSAAAPVSKHARSHSEEPATSPKRQKISSSTSSEGAISPLLPSSTLTRTTPALSSLPPLSLDKVAIPAHTAGETARADSPLSIDTAATILPAGTNETFAARPNEAKMVVEDVDTPRSLVASTMLQETFLASASTVKKEEVVDSPRSLVASTILPETVPVSSSTRKVAEVVDSPRSLGMATTSPEPFDNNWPRNKPHVPGFHPSIAKVEDKIREFSRRVTKPAEELTRQGHRDDFLEAFVRKFADRMNAVARSDENEIVALLGDMGIGKSEAYEALIGHDGIAIKSDSGRGTHFPIEGHSRTATQATPFVVVMVWKLVAAMQKTVEACCHDILAYLDGARTEAIVDEEIDDSDEEADGSALDSNGALERQHRYQEALRHLLPLLYGEDNASFQSCENLSAYFEALLPGDHSDVAVVARPLLHRITALRQQHKIGTSTSSITANSAREAAAILANFSPATFAQSEKSPRWDQSRHLEKAQIHCDNDMGCEGVIFTDVPGRNDSDLAMGEAVEEYVSKHPNRYLIMAPAGRPVTAESDKYLRDAIKSRKPTIFVVTKIDLKDELSVKERADLASWELEEIVKAERDVEDVKKKRSATERDQAELEARNRHQEANVLDKAIARLNRVELHRAQAKLHQLFVETRNRKEEAEIHAQYHNLARSRPGVSDLQVVFISAKEYGKHRRGERTMLDYEATGIPKLFRLLYRDIAHKRMEKLQRLCRVDLPRSIGAIQHVLNKTPVQRHQAFKDAITNTFEKWTPLFNRAAGQVLADWTNEHITVPFKHGRNKIWPAAGAELFDSWTRKVRGMTFHAFCKRSGNWRIAGKEVSWNARIQHKIAGDKGGVVDGFNNLLGEIEKVRCGHSTKMMKQLIHIVGFHIQDAEDMATVLFQALNTALRDGHFHDLPSSKTFLKHMKDAKQDFRTTLDKLFHKYSDKIENIKNNTVICGSTARGATDDSYVGQCMNPIYGKAAAVNKAKVDIPSEPQYTNPVRGKRKKINITPAFVAHDLRKTMIRAKLLKGPKSVFKEVHDMVEEDMKNASSDFLHSIEEACTDMSQSLLQHFDAFYILEGEVEEDQVREQTAPLREAVARVLSELPSEGNGGDGDPQGTNLHEEEQQQQQVMETEMGELEKLLKECESWETLYPSEQQG